MRKSVLGVWLLCCASQLVWAGEMRVLVTASLQPAMAQLSQAYQAQHPEVQITLVTGASSALARQIHQGAPADIYISANQEWMDYLLQQSRVTVLEQKPLLANQLVVVSKTARPSFNLMQLESWQAALAGGRLAVADPQHVPAGMYAKQAMTQLGLWSGLHAQMAFSHNVRATLALVERGAAPLGVVYASDAATSQQVVTLAQFPENAHGPIVYPAGRLSSAQGVQAFYDYLWSVQGQSTWQAFGFSALALAEPALSVESQP